jgi:hypothetical protein
MTVTRGFVITIASGVGFATVGALLGFALGRLAPDYYRFVFRGPPQIDLDPAQAGLGLGASQGLGGGLFIGLVIVVAVAWSKSRRSDKSKPVS